MSDNGFQDQRERIDHAERRGAELAAAIQNWVAGDPWTVEPVIAEDRLSYELRLRVSSPPPTKAWSKDFADGVHNLRAALDNLTRTIAAEAGVIDPKALRRLSFPIAATKDEWTNAKRRIADLPPSYRLAIENIQPFQRRGGPAGTPEGDLLRLLRDLDNTDKHAVQVVPLLQHASIQNHFGVEFETEAGAAASVPPDVTYSAHDFSDGAVLIEHRTRGRIKKVTGTYEMQVQVQVIGDRGEALGLTWILSALCYYTRQVLEYVVSEGQNAQPRP